MQGLDIITASHQGFKPLVNFGSWRVAFLNGSQSYEGKVIDSLSRHLETDEVFVLVKGSCLLITAGNGDNPGEVTKTWMEPGVVYNVTKGAWHGHIVLPGTMVMIVENRDTGSNNSESRPVKEKISL